MRQSQHVPTPPQSLRQGSISSVATVSQRPRANAVVSSLLYKPKPKPGKRRRQSQQEQVKKELQDLEIKDPKSRASLETRKPSEIEVVDLCGGTPTPPPNKRPRADNENLAVPSPAHSHNSTRGSDIEDTFVFKAILARHSDASIEFLHSQEDLADAAEALWERIRELHDTWEEAKGEDWAYEFEVKLRNQDSKHCVSSKLRIQGRELGRSMWRPGCECLYACSQCVTEGRPCFVWTQDEFRLLPLHDDDRIWPVKKGAEVRQWINLE